MSRKEQIWYKDVVHFITDMESLIHFIPDGKSSLEAQLNDVFRFAIYFGILVAIMRNDLRALFFPAFVGLLTYLIYNHDEQQKQSRKQLLEKLHLQESRTEKQICMNPTANNPYMNVLISDYGTFPNRPGACKPTDKKIKAKVQKLALDTVPIDIDNVYSRRLSDLQFNTMPSTTIPNEQTNFANWLYNKGGSTKEKGVLSFDWR